MVTYQLTVEAEKPDDLHEGMWLYFASAEPWVLARGIVTEARANDADVEFQFMRSRHGDAVTPHVGWRLSTSFSLSEPNE